MKNLRSFFKKENNKKQEKQEKQVLQDIFFVFWRPSTQEEVTAHSQLPVVEIKQNFIEI